MSLELRVWCLLPMLWCLVLSIWGLSLFRPRCCHCFVDGRMGGMVVLLSSVIVGCCCCFLLWFSITGFFSLVVLFKFWLWLWLWFIPKCVLFIVFVFTVSGYCSVHFGCWCLFWKLLLWAMICESNGTDSPGKMASSEGSLAANLWSFFLAVSRWSRSLHSHNSFPCWLESLVCLVVGVQVLIRLTWVVFWFFFF